MAPLTEMRENADHKPNGAVLLGTSMLAILVSNLVFAVVFITVVAMCACCCGDESTKKTKRRNRELSKKDQDSDLREDSKIPGEQFAGSVGVSLGMEPSPARAPPAPPVMQQRAVAKDSGKAHTQPKKEALEPRKPLDHGELKRPIVHGADRGVAKIAEQKSGGAGYAIGFRKLVQMAKQPKGRGEPAHGVRKEMEKKPADYVPPPDITRSRQNSVVLTRIQPGRTPPVKFISKETYENLDYARGNSAQYESLAGIGDPFSASQIASFKLEQQMLAILEHQLKAAPKGEEKERQQAKKPNQKATPRPPQSGRVVSKLVHPPTKIHPAATAKTATTKGPHKHHVDEPSTMASVTGKPSEASEE